MNKMPYLDIKLIFKEKLLDIYEANPILLDKLDLLIKIDNKKRFWGSDSFGKPDPNENYFDDTFFMGLLVALLPEVVDILILFEKINNNPYEVVQFLELNFHPISELKKRAKAKRLAQEVTLIEDSNIIRLLSEDPEYREAYEGLNQIREQIRQDNSS